jgi:hypothetical protein
LENGGERWPLGGGRVLEVIESFTK